MLRLVLNCQLWFWRQVRRLKSFNRVSNSWVLADLHELVGAWPHAYLWMGPPLINTWSILGDPGAVSGGAKKSKRARKNSSEEKSRTRERAPGGKVFTDQFQTPRVFFSFSFFSPLRTTQTNMASNWLVCTFRVSKHETTPSLAALWLGRKKKQKFPGTNQKLELLRRFGTGPLRPRPLWLFPAPTNCPWVSEDALDPVTPNEPCFHNSSGNSMLQKINTFSKNSQIL